MPLVDIYNNISRLRLKLPFFLSQIDKDATSNKLRVQADDSDAIKYAKLRLYANLIGFKYYRQNATENIAEQEVLLSNVKEIVESKKLDLNLNLFECMAYVRNDGYIVQRKITGHFREVLQGLEPADRVTLNNYVEKLDLSFDLDDNQSIINRIKQFFYENIGFALSKKLERSGKEIKSGKNTKDGFLAECEKLKFSQPQWLDYMKSELINPIVIACLNAHTMRPEDFKAPIEPAEAVEVLNTMDIKDFVEITHAGGYGRQRNTYGFTEKFISDTGNTIGFQKATEIKEGGRVPHMASTIWAKGTYKGSDAHQMTDFRNQMGQKLVNHFLDTVVGIRNQSQSLLTSHK